MGSTPKDILPLPLVQCQLHYQSLVPLAGGSCSSSENPGIERVCEVVLHPLKRMPFGDQCSDFPTSVNILHDLMESGGDDGVTMNPRSSQSKLYEVSASIT